MSIPKESKERRERGGDDGLQSRKGDDDVRRRRRRRPEGGLEASSGTPFDLSGSGRRGTPVRARTEGWANITRPWSLAQEGAESLREPGIPPRRSGSGAKRPGTCAASGQARLVPGSSANQMASTVGSPEMNCGGCCNARKGFAPL